RGRLWFPVEAEYAGSLAVQYLVDVEEIVALVMKDDRGDALEGVQSHDQGRSHDRRKPQPFRPRASHRLVSAGFRGGPVRAPAAGVELCGRAGVKQPAIG